MSDRVTLGNFQSADNRQGVALRLASLGILALLLGLVFQDGLSSMIGQWGSEEYSHGYLIPAVSLFLIWRNRHQLAAAGQRGTWFGAVIVLLGLAMFIMGELGTIYTVVQYAFLVTLFGAALAFFGWSGMRFLWVPLLYLVFMIPLPQFLYSGLSSDLQLISSQLGVMVIRLFGISVFLDGNVIDLGVYVLQVVEACSGLRYLFPLMSFGFLVAHLSQGPLWQRSVVFLSTIPITILMNSFRIGVIGVLVENYGIEMADGFLHSFEGWFIFMACVLILFGEIWLLNKIFGTGGSVFDRFAITTPPPPPTSVPPGDKTAPVGRLLPRPYLASMAIVILAAAATSLMGERAEAALERQVFATLPMRIDDWHGRELALDREIVETLKVTDYIMADYRRDSDPMAVNFYVAYYNSQRKGESVHSPQACIPGDGWRIESFGEHRLDNVIAAGQPLTVNRAIIGKGDFQQLVYYWFPQRDRFLTNEYWVKWYIFWDALIRNRTDGALIRLVTPVLGPDGFDAADQRLSEFAASLLPKLSPHFPS
ncbi:MAG: VPLPA-CTERM-specific exosortase XrtD [Alphaproteobacteria bacterium]